MGRCSTCKRLGWDKDEVIRYQASLIGKAALREKIDRVLLRRRAFNLLKCDRCQRKEKDGVQA